MNTRTQLLCAWSGPVFAVLFGLGWFVVASFLPPHLPAAGAEDIATIYAQDLNRIRIGMVLSMYASGFYGPWVALIYVLMRRIEGRAAPVLSMTQLISGTMGILVFLLPPMLWIAAAFRPERDAALVLALNDTAWLYLTMVVSPFIFQYLALGLAVLADERAQPLLPRWLGYFAIWAAVIFIPAGMIAFFKSGPFAWNGFIGFWLPACTFFASIFVFTVYFARAVRNTQYPAAA